MEQASKSGNGYGKRPLWQWIIIYVILAAIAYGLVYYFVLSKGGGYISTKSSQTYPPATQNASQPSLPSNATISIKNLSFNPSTMTIKTGTKVVWVNDDSVSHTVTSDSGNLFSSSTISPGQSFNFTFNNPGSVTYHCGIHPVMKGTVVVKN